MKKILIISFIVLTATLPVYAQTGGGGSNTNNPTSNRLPTYTLLEPLPCIPNATPAADDPCTKAGEIQTQLNFKYYVQYMFNLLIALAAVASVFMIVYGGFQYMSTDSWQGKSDGLSKVKNALLGLLLVLTSFIILRTIDPRLVAIPTTLVPPLNIQYESVAAGLFEQIAQEAAHYNRQTNILAAQKSQLRGLVTGLEEELKTLESDRGILSKEGVAATDPRVKTLDDKILQVKNDMIGQKGNLELKNAQANITLAIHQQVNSPDEEGKATKPTLDSVRVGREAALKTYQDAILTLSKLEQDSATLNKKIQPDPIFESHRKELRATYYPIYGDLLLLENTILSRSADINQAKKALADIQEVEKIVIPRILDLQKRAELLQRYKQTASLLSERVKNFNYLRQIDKS